MVLVQILENLYIGSLSDIKQTSDLISKGVKCILTVDQKPLMETYHQGFRYKHFPLLDLDSEDLLGILDNSYEFIDCSRNIGEAIAIHCNAGQSRSAAIVIAYLMKKLILSFDGALEYVKKLKSDVSPNHGFAMQLKMYEAMGYTLERTNKKFKQYQMERIMNLISSGREVPSEILFRNSAEVTSGGNAAVYKCRKCRRLMFCEDNVLDHNEGPGSVAFKYSHKNSSASESQSNCQYGLFIEPVKWMQELNLHEMEGKICCLKCGAKIGSWSWTGEQCHCGRWITPAFHIDKKKVDRSAVLPDLASRRSSSSMASQSCT